MFYLFSDDRGKATCYYHHKIDQPVNVKVFLLIYPSSDIQTEIWHQKLPISCVHPFALHNSEPSCADYPASDRIDYTVFKGEPLVTIYSQ